MSKNKSPWGSGSSGDGAGGNGSGGGKKPWGQAGKPDRSKPRPGEASPDLDNVIQGFKNQFGKGGGGRGPRLGGGGDSNNPLTRYGPFGIFVLVGLVFLIASCFYTVKQQEEAVVLRFGEYSRTTVSGLHFKLPTPIETTHKINVTTQRSIESSQNLVLTGDENIADIDFTVRWNVKSSENYLFNLETPAPVVEDAADSALREIIGKKTLESVITTERQPIEFEVKQLLQEMLDTFKSGVEVTVVQLQRAEAPPKVIQAFEDVVTAEQELEQRVNEGLAYRNEVTEKAVGDAAVIVEAAEGYKQEVVSVATGEADRFLAVYNEYKAAPRVTRQRIYLETIEEVYRDADKMILDQGASSNIVPYLPLDQLSKKAGAN